MAREMLVNVAESEECRVAVVEDGTLDELYFERASIASHVGNTARSLDETWHKRKEIGCFPFASRTGSALVKLLVAPSRPLIGLRDEYPHSVTDDQSL